MFPFLKRIKKIVRLKCLEVIFVRLGSPVRFIFFKIKKLDLIFLKINLLQIYYVYYFIEFFN